MKLRLTFLDDRRQRVKFLSFIYTINTYSHILVRRGDSYNHYLRLYKGIIEIVRFHKESEEMRLMKPYNKFSLKHAARIYQDSTLTKTEEALLALNQILDSDDEDDRINFLESKGSEAAKREKPNKIERAFNKANSITLEQISQELGVEPSKLRRSLRKHEYPKPGSSWIWAKSKHDSLIKEFQKFLR